MVDPEMLVIADRDRPQAVAGVMGGASAEVSPATRFVAFESAYFKPSSVRRTSKRLGLKTEASARFERGADIDAPVAALARIAALMVDIGAGRSLDPVQDVYPSTREPVRVHLRRSQIPRLLGVDVPDREVERILPSLGLSIARDEDGWNVVVPTFRVDIAREVDLIEEVGRHYGFDKLPDTFPPIEAPAAAPDPRVLRDQLVRRLLTAAGLGEAVTFGIIEARAAAPFAHRQASPPVAIANPLSAKFDTLRPSLLPGLIDSVAHNRRHGRDAVGLFEIGTTFSAAGESRAAAIAWTGPAAAPHWSQPAREVDFFDVKGVVQALCRALGVPVRFTTAVDDAFTPGRAAAIVNATGERVGVAGQLSAAIAEARGLPRQDRVFASELDLDRLWQLRETATDTTSPLPRHPFVVRDVSIVVADTLPAETIHGTIQAAGAAAPAPLINIAFFDRYQGKGIPEGSVSLSVRMTFQAPDRTLTDAEVLASVEAILAALARDHQAVQR
jgi:phenylalanyl-tRNA synthetase beta chain